MEKCVSGRSEALCVAVRVRPINSRELPRQDAPDITWKTESNSIYQLIKGIPNPSATFSFDYLFTEKATNGDIFRAVAAPIVKSVVDGFSGVIFAYGQTSSGKTHTMLGNSEDLGVTRRSVQAIFQHIKENPNWLFAMRASYVEIYNENIKDLLNPGSEHLKIREDAFTGQVYVECVELPIASVKDVMKMISDGERYRSVGETNMNERSSRSHTIFTIKLQSKKINASGSNKDSEGLVVRKSSLSLVDLAGSERASLSGAEGQRLKEGSHINKSLLTLGTVIYKLSSASGNAMNAHIPYRDSKLTRLLQPALGGNAKTGIICAITPAVLHVEETLSTLKFASRAKKVTNRTTCVEILDDKAKLRRAEREIERLKKELQNQSNGNSVQKYVPNYSAEQEDVRESISQVSAVNERRLMGSSSAVSLPDSTSLFSQSSTEVVSPESNHESVSADMQVRAGNLLDEIEHLRNLIASVESELTKKTKKCRDLERRLNESECAVFVREVLDDVTSRQERKIRYNAGEESRDADSMNETVKSHKVSNVRKIAPSRNAILIAALSVVIQNRDARLEVARADAENLKSMLPVLEGERRSLHPKLLETKSSLEEKDRSLERDQGEERKTEVNVAHLNIKPSSHKESRGADAESINSTLDQLNSARRERDTLLDEVSRVREELSVEKRRVRKLEAVVNERGNIFCESEEAENPTLLDREELKEIGIKSDELASSVSKLPKELSFKIGRIKQLEEVVGQKRQQMSETEHQVNMHASNLSPGSAGDRENRTLFELAKLDEEHICERILGVEAKKRGPEEDLKKVANMVSLEREKVQRAEVERGQLCNRLKDLEEKLPIWESLERKVESLEEARHVIELRLERTSIELDASQKEVISLSQEKRILVTKIKELEGQLSSIVPVSAEEYQFLKKERASMVSKCEKLGKLLTSEQERNVELSKALEDLTAQCNQNSILGSRDRRALVEELSETKKNYAKIKDAYKKVESDLDRNVTESRLNARSSKTIIRDLERQLAKYLRRIEVSVHEQEKLLRVINSRDKRIFDLQEKLEDYRRGNGAIKRLEKKLQQREKEIRALEHRLQKEEELLVHGGLGQVCLDVQKVAKLESEVEYIQAELEKEKAQRNGVEGEREALKDENMKLRDKIKESDVAKLRLAASLKSTQAQLYEIKTQDALTHDKLQVSQATSKGGRNTENDSRLHNEGKENAVLSS